MSDLANNFKEIMEDIENNISDEKELKYINKKITEITALHLQVIENLTYVLKNKIDEIERMQKLMENKLNKIETSISGIENDIYDEGFDFEIICPYCNTEFTADVESKTDIKCPECQNTIELDWNTEEFSECSGHCSGCSSKCGSSFLEEFNTNNGDNVQDDDDM